MNEENVGKIGLDLARHASLLEEVTPTAEVTELHPEPKEGEEATPKPKRRVSKKKPKRRVSKKKPRRRVSKKKSRRKSAKKKK